MIYSPPDIVLVLGIALLVFGPKRLPELGAAIGQGIGNFKKSMSEVETSLRSTVPTASSVPVAVASSTPLASTSTAPISSADAVQESQKGAS